MAFGFLAVGAFGATAVTGVAISAATIGAAVTAKSSKKAKESQERQGQAALDVREDEFGRFEQTLSPFIRGETPEQQQQRALIGLEGPEAQQQAQLALETPTTRTIREEGLRGLDQRFSAVGGLGGSNRVREALRLSQQFDRQFSGNQFNMLGALGSQRQGAALALGGAGSQFASGQAQTFQNIGRAQGQENIRTGEIIQGGIEDFGSLALSSLSRQNESGVSRFGPKARPSSPFGTFDVNTLQNVTGTA